MKSFLCALPVTLAASTAFACPACAGRNDGGPGLFVAYAAMVISPFIATAIVIRILKPMLLNKDGQ